MGHKIAKQIMIYITDPDPNQLMGFCQELKATLVEIKPWANVATAQAKLQIAKRKKRNRPTAGEIEQLKGSQKVRYMIDLYGLQLSKIQ